MVDRLATKKIWKCNLFDYDWYKYVRAVLPVNFISYLQHNRGGLEFSTEGGDLNGMEINVLLTKECIVLPHGSCMK